MFKHSIKVPRLYKVASKVAKEVHERVGSIKQLVYDHQKKHPNIKAIYALVSTLFQKKDEIETLLKRSQVLVKEPRLDSWLVKILMVELLWGKKSLPGTSKPENTIRAYEQNFKAHLSDITIPEDQNNEEFIMVEVSDVVTENQNAPLLPVHTKQAAKALALLLFFSFLMFSLPFGAFFATKYLLEDYLQIVGFANTVWSVLAAVITVNTIIVCYAYIAYHEPEYDDEGNLIEKKQEKTSLNLKQE